MAKKKTELQSCKRIKRTLIIISLSAVFQISAFAQTVKFSEFLEETRNVVEKTAYEADIEYTYDVKQITERDGKKSLKTFEAVCSKKRCVYILTEKDGVPLPENEITKNREKAAQKLLKAENSAEANTSILNIGGVVIFTDALPDHFYSKSAYFNPNIYLKNCKIDFVEKTLIENRAAIKVNATECSDKVKRGVKIMPKTQASIWIDEQDKAVAKMEIYGGEDIINFSTADKPFVIMEAARIPAGFWFWKFETANTAGLFKKDSKHSIEFFNYRPYSVIVEKVEINKK